MLCNNDSIIDLAAAHSVSQTLTVNLIGSLKYNSSFRTTSARPVRANFDAGYAPYIGTATSGIRLPRILLMMKIWPGTDRSFMSLTASRIQIQVATTFTLNVSRKSAESLSVWILHGIISKHLYEKVLTLTRYEITPKNPCITN